MDFAVSTVATERPPRSTVTRSETAITSCSLWEMKITVRPVRSHRPQCLEQRRGLLRGEDGGRLVEDQDPRFPVKSLQDLDALLLPDRKLPDAGARVDGHPVALPELRHSLLDRARMEAERPADIARVAEHHVLGDRERLDEPEVLVHHPDARIDPVARGVEGDGSTVDLHHSFVCAIEAGEDVREGALAGAVLAEQSVDLTLERLEVDRVVGDDSGEPLGDPTAGDRGARTATRQRNRSRFRRGTHGTTGTGWGSGHAAPPLR